jgi:nucleotidyltransferase/DNA polymerase involved in DNA repair
MLVRLISASVNCVVRAVFEAKTGSWTRAAAVPVQVWRDHAESLVERSEGAAPVEICSHGDTVQQQHGRCPRRPRQVPIGDRPAARQPQCLVAPDQCVAPHRVNLP